MMSSPTVAAAIPPPSPSASTLSLTRTTASSLSLLGRHADRITPLSYLGLHYLITDCPTEQNVAIYAEECAKNNVRHLVRFCESPYKTDAFVAHGIRVHDLPFKDGAPPPESVIRKWLAIVDECEAAPKSEGGEVPGICVHCVAGLGRAPVMVAIALIEQGMKSLDAIEFIRKHRKSAFNSKQIGFVDDYKRRTKATFRLSISKIFKK